MQGGLIRLRHRPYPIRNAEIISMMLAQDLNIDDVIRASRIAGAEVGHSEAKELIERLDLDRAAKAGSGPTGTSCSFTKAWADMAQQILNFTRLNAKD